MIWYIKNWNKFTADNKRTFILGITFFVYAGYLLFVLIFPQYFNIGFNKILAFFILLVLIVTSFQINRNSKNQEKLDKQIKSLEALNEQIDGKIKVAKQELHKSEQEILNKL